MLIVLVAGLLVGCLAVLIVKKNREDPWGRQTEAVRDFFAHFSPYPGKA